MIMGASILVGALYVQKHFLENDLLNKIMSIYVSFYIGVVILQVIYIIIRYRGKYFKYRKIRKMLEDNLISINAYEKKQINYLIMPKIKIRKNIIKIRLKNIKVRKIIERYMDSLSTALVNDFVVEECFITPSNNELIIKYEDISKYVQESYTLREYEEIVKKTFPAEFYLDKKHIYSFEKYPHLLISGATSSGKSYLANQVIIQAIIKKWDVTILDIKRSYGIYRENVEYETDAKAILNKLNKLEAEMYQRIKDLEPMLNISPKALAIDLGYKEKIILIEEYISLKNLLDKKEKEELEQIVKNISVLGRVANIHVLLVMQSANTENINSTTRAQFSKILLGQNNSNIITGTFGNNITLPTTRIEKYQGYIQLDKITVLKVLELKDMEKVKTVIGEGAEGNRNQFEEE